jgi:hypothetical protein
MPATNDLESAALAALVAAGQKLKDDLWTDGDRGFLAARAKDLVGLNAKAAEATSAAKKAAYQAAARDVVDHVKLLALIRMQVAQEHALDALGRFFLDTALPALLKILPALL